MIRSEKLREKANQALALAQDIDRRMAEAEGDQSEADEKALAEAMANHDKYAIEADKAAVFEQKMADAEARANTPPARVGGRPVDPTRPAPHTDPGNTRDGRHQYSFLKALRQQLDAREGRGRLDGLEAEVDQHLAQLRGRSPIGVYIPTDIPFRVGDSSGVQRRDLDTSGGTGAVLNTYGSFIDILRNRLAINQMGATIMTGMTGSFALPKQTASATAYWVAEGGAPTESSPTIGQVALTPKTVGAYTDYTRKFMLQSSIDAESFVRNDLMAVVARAVDLAAVNGSGSSNQPLGILAYGSPVETVAIGTNGGPLTWAKLVEMESAVAVDNADVGNLGYLTNSKVRGQLKTVEKASGYPVYLMGDDGEALNGYPMRVSNQIPSNLTKGTANGTCSAVIFGNWSDLIVAFWSGMDVMVDPYTASTSGTVRIVVLQDVDLDLRNGESFSIIKDVVTG